ncbi:MAG: MBL fold metallo-hydrolase [Candidatus Aminicenantes bacterium]|nr:MAG: MBL fold metallo-hydrolase [Candidatus Aminicenantes bacterium]
MIEVCGLASGSNGNAFFIRTGVDCFLVDAGISCKQICRRLRQIRHHIDEIKAIFITHEHSDHVRGLRVLLDRFQIPIYITEKTYNRLPEVIDENLVHFIESDDSITFNNTLIQSMPKSHDAVDPSLFSFYYKDKKISVVTDIGYACDNVIEAVKGAHIVFLESNYDETMLWEGFYPYFLKQRVAGEYGHLSNAMAGELILNHASPGLEYVLLSHLSENNNMPDIALETFQSVIKEREDLRHLQTILTSRYGISPVVKIDTEAPRLFKINPWEIK